MNCLCVHGWSLLVGFNVTLHCVHVLCTVFISLKLFVVMVIRLGEVSGTACRQTGGFFLMFAGSFFFSLEF